MTAFEFPARARRSNRYEDSLNQPDRGDLQEHPDAARSPPT